MFVITPTLRRLVLTLALAAPLAVVAVPQALAGSGSKYGPPDPWYAYAVALTKASHSATIDGRSPDTKDAASSAHEALARTASSPVERILLQESARKHDPRLYGSSIETQSTQLDGRSPDTVDAAAQAHAPVVTIIRPSGFGWGEFGIGVAAAFGAMLLLGVSIRLLATRQSRGQPGPVAAA